LSRQLRDNNPTFQLPDTDGDRWITLTQHVHHNKQLAKDFTSGLEAQLKIDIQQLLKLSPRDKFSVNRFLGLWRHGDFRKLCTAWCETSVGRGSFSLLVFSRLKEHRIAHVRKIFRRFSACYYE